jgi:hypothetical protein
MLALTRVKRNRNGDDRSGRNVESGGSAIGNKLQFELLNVE